jgi:ribosome biogenesis GTPase A
MTIEWFPGHMATARREAVATMRNTDVVIEVLDARVPRSSLNPLFETLRKENQRPALKILNKADVADPDETERWLAHYNALPKTRAIALSARKENGARSIPKECLALAPTRTSKLKPLRMMILGIPNVGKSTLMNALLHRHVAKVGDEPAITKNQMKHALAPTQWIVDTPGMTWPGLDQDVAWRLAATHSIGRNAYDEVAVAVELGGLLLQLYPALLAARYGTLPAGHELLGHVAQARKLLRDPIPTAAAALLNDFRGGALGRITLDRLGDTAAPVATPPA